MVPIPIIRRRAGPIKVTLFAAALGVMGLTFFLNTADTLFEHHGIIRALDWKYPQYLIDYFDFGFVKRGLIASLLAPIPPPAKVPAILALNIIVLSALAAVAVTVLVQASQRLEPAQSRLLVAITIFSPLTFTNLGYDFGRFDAINLLILFASLWLLRRDRVFVVALLTGVALLIHEAYLFYGVPLAFLYPWYRLRNSEGHYLDRTSRIRRYLIKISPVGLIMSFCLGLLLLFGRYEPGLARMHQAVSDQFADKALTVWTRPMIQNFNYVAAVRWSHPDPIRQLAALLIVICLLIVLTTVIVAVHRSNNKRLDALAFAPACILPLFALGVDYSRWFSLMWIVALTVLVIKIFEGELFRIGSGTRFNTACLLILCAIPLGPIGIDKYFPLFRHFVCAYSLCF